jgi:hypothetical protein
VHASWDEKATTAFRGIKRIDEDTLRAMVDRKSRIHGHKQNLLHGLELNLPKGRYASDKSGVNRKEMRARWWEPLAGRTYSQVSFPFCETVPDSAIPESVANRQLTYPPEEPPVFFGHYWLPADAAKAPLAPNVACLDYSVAKGGDLTAYRWGGEQVLNADKFVDAK